MMKPRNTLYHAYLPADLKREATGEGAALTQDERDTVQRANTLWDYDERFIAARHGFDGIEDYYSICSPMGYLPEIRLPTLMLAAGDDPWVPAEFYREFDWTTNPALLPLLPTMGGHVGLHGEGKQRWSDLAIGRFFEKVVSRS